jgi:archaemetzincin
MTDTVITIIPIGEVSTFILEYIGKSLERTFNAVAKIVPGQNINSHIPGPFYGGRYNSTSILKYLSERVPGDTLKLLAVTESDLYSPIFSCMFGEAQLGGPCALVSLHRLRQEFYNLAPDQDIFLSRCEKEVIHEIAHTVGLLHCSDKNCVMYPSNNIIDTDVKSNSFCSTCAGLLKS